MKKVLVMGGSYFIGKHVVNQLKYHYEVYVLNRGNHPFNDTLIKELKCDRNDQKKLKDTLRPFGFHYVVDISGYTKVHSDFLLNALNLNVLEKMVYVSTSAAYNKNILIPPFKEDDALGGKSPFKAYAQDKIEAEDYLLNHLEKDQLVIFRPPIVYGEDNYILRERLVFYLIDNQLPVYVPQSDNSISFVYVKDLTQDVLLALQGIIPAGIYNVGNKASLSFTDWVNMCGHVMNKKASITYVDQTHPDLDIRYFFPFYDYDNILSVEKIKAYAPNETPMTIGLANAYKDYLDLKEPLLIPEKMREMRALIERFLQEKYTSIK